MLTTEGVREHQHLGSFAAGPPIDTADLNTASGTATYIGHAIGDVYDAGKLRTVAGTFQESFNFTSRTGATSLDFDGRSFGNVAATTSTLAGQEYRSRVALSEGGAKGEAERAAKAAVRRFETQGARGRLDMVPSLNLLAEIALGDGRIDEALAQARRAVGIQEELSAVSPDRVARSRRILADVLLAACDIDGALRLARLNRDLIAERLEALSRRTSLSAEFRTGATRRQIGQLVEILATIGADRNGTSDPAVEEELFAAIQLLSLNQSAKALNAAVAKTVVKGEAAALIERRQRMAGEVAGLWRQVERLAMEDGPLEIDRLASTQREIAELEKALAEADRALAEVAPDYLALVKPRVRTLAEARHALGPGEAVWMNASFARGTLVLLIARDSVTMRWTDLDADSLYRIVADLRDSIVVRPGGLIPEFRPERARALYDALFAPVEDALAQAESLILVPDGAAQQIPLGLALAPAEVEGGDDGDLAERHLGLAKAMGVVPSVDAFLALRAASRPGMSIEGNFTGFGNPDFSIGSEPQPEGELRLALASPKGFIENTNALRQVFRPLPETEFELRYLADAIGTSQRQLFVRGDATETRVKSEDLSAVSVLAFATHAVASGEFDGSNEPGLALTPPAEGSSFDDGFLSASEIATLSLSAELVILSACNTGSPELRSGAEGLSGPARAFFHAGARSLLVSHWPVDSQATVYITTQMAEARRQDPRLTQAQALRASLRAVASGRYDQAFAHPFYWAPFFLVSDVG